MGGVGQMVSKTFPFLKVRGHDRKIGGYSGLSLNVLKDKLRHIKLLA